MIFLALLILPAWILPEAGHAGPQNFSAVSGTRQITSMVAMRDGVRLATDVYVPLLGTGPWPAILVRTPYGRGLGASLDEVLTLLSEALGGYVLVVQDMRGRGGSEGVDSLYFSDGWGRERDGYDTVEWVAAQPWSDGKVGMWGASALGIVQYLAAGAAPPSLVCGCAIVATGNLYEHALFQGGAYRRALVDGWLHDLKRDSLQAYFIHHPHYDSGYDRVNLSARVDSVRVPFLHIGGWHDIFTQGTIDAFTGLHYSGGDGARGRQKMIIGPWVHNILDWRIGELSYPNASPLLFFQTMIDWFDYWLKDRDNGVDREPPVQIYLMGDADDWEGPGNRWLSLDHWPPDFTPVHFYLRADGTLGLDRPGWDEPPRAFTYDPADPVPTRGGRNLNIPAGPVDQRLNEARAEVLTYTTEILTDTVVIAGPVTVTLRAGSDATDTDFTASLSDVYPDGRSMLVADGIIRARHRNSIVEEAFLLPGEIPEYTIDLWATAVAFAPGHRIRLSISSSNFPRFEANPNTGEPFRLHTGMQTASQVVYHDAARPSALILPVLSGVETGVRSRPLRIAGGLRLEPNYPNPFNAATLLSFQVDGQVREGVLHILNLRGEILRTWILAGYAPGRHALIWDGTDHRGRAVSSGVYVVRLAGGGRIVTRKITLLK